jgi:hypothetical protein
MSFTYLFSKKLKGGMNMEKQQFLGVFAVAIVALLGFSFVSAQGFGFFGGDKTGDQIADMEANREAMRNAVETGNYAAWEGLMHERLADMESTLEDVENSINEDTFAEIQERHGSMAGFEGRGMGSGSGMHKGLGDRANCQKN